MCGKEPGKSAIIAAWCEAYAAGISRNHTTGLAMMMRRFIAAAVLVLMGLPAYAAMVLTVESVLSPAWVERANGRREPLAAGMELNNKEKVHTGDGDRALLRLAEGS